MNIGKAAKEGTNKSVECKVSSSNPSTSVGMEFLIDGKKQKYNKSQETKTPGSHNGMLKTFAFTFTTDRSQNDKVAKCRLMWEGTFSQMEKEANLTITCKQQFFHVISDLS